MKDIRDVISGAIDNTDVDELVTQQSVDNLVEEIFEALSKEYDTHPDMVERYYEIASQIDLAENFRVVVAQDREKPFGRWFYQIKFFRKDVIIGEDGWGYGGKAYLSPHASDNELVQTIFGLYKGVWEHEARESFQWNGRRVFGPHIATQALWDVAKRINVRNAKHMDDTPTQEEDEEAQLAALRAKLSGPSKYQDQMEAPKKTFSMFDNVSWDSEGLNTDIVRGTVVNISEEEQKVKVSWANGSGPTWHGMHEIQKL